MDQQYNSMSQDTYMYISTLCLRILTSLAFLLNTTFAPSEHWSTGGLPAGSWEYDVTPIADGAPWPSLALDPDPVVALTALPLQAIFIHATTGVTHLKPCGQFGCGTHHGTVGGRVFSAAPTPSSTRTPSRLELGLGAPLGASQVCNMCPTAEPLMTSLGGSTSGHRGGVSRSPGKDSGLQRAPIPRGPCDRSITREFRSQRYDLRCAGHLGRTNGWMEGGWDRLDGRVLRSDCPFSTSLRLSGSTSPPIPFVFLRTTSPNASLTFSWRLCKIFSPTGPSPTSETFVRA
ncbi:hypothetical protein DFP72DRAFT_454414 [Ephemerocybe angulata]|uniref:Uncharacterized protein n=1 Tax=Ephemerocybe angulata TaxID=980116 RepID=A0A8H6M461_9AGAR|nr:hypothetical protein DFP72DRAFT_454414 [Tulosesus angulatus]